MPDIEPVRPAWGNIDEWVGMDKTAFEAIIDRDRAVMWHPYSAIDTGAPVFPVVSASGVRLTLADDRELLDGMAS